MEVKKQKIKK